MSNESSAQPSRGLPAQPSIEQLRKQAREHQHAHPGIRLSEAQRELARTYGFASWPKLLRHVQNLRGHLSARDAFVTAALGGQLDEADALVAANPDLVQEPVVAALRGDADRAPRIDPLAAYAPRGWTALHYLCFSRFHSRAELHSVLIRTAKDLLDRGADPNAFHIDPVYPDPPSTSLYGVCGRSDRPDIVALLLAAGANPQDGEALYHGTELATFDGIRLVLEAGGITKDTNGVAHMLDRDSPEGLAMMLAHYGGPPDDYLGSCLHHALIRARTTTHLRLLVEYGADPHYRRDGVNPYVRARLLGLDEQAEYFHSIGADEVVTEAERFALAALDGTPIEDETPPKELGWTVVYAAGNGHLDVLRRLMDAGFDPNALDGWGRTGLHEAGWAGRTDEVRLLLERGSSVAIIDPHHGGTPLNWTVFGAANGLRPEGDQVGVARLLLEAGAADHCSRQWIDGLTKNLPEMRAVLAEYGVIKK